MNNYVSALDLINLSNEVGNALVRSDHAINELQLNSNNYNFEEIWNEILDIQFWDLDEQDQRAAKNVCCELFKAACAANAESLIIDDAFIAEYISDNDQFEFDF
jgi:hypothetical protein